MSNDPRVVYGANCCWWDSIDKANKTASGLPCCPNCGSVLFEMENAEKWWKSVDDFEHGRTPSSEPHEGYRKFIEWSQGKCFSSMAIALAAYNRDTTDEVEGM